MAKKKDNSLAAAVVFAAVMISGSLIYFGSQMMSPSSDDLAENIQKGIEDYVNGVDSTTAKAEPVEMEDLVKGQPFMGAEDAPVVLVEFSDYKCGYCQKFFNETLPQIKENYIDTGKVQFVYKDFLLGYEGDYEAALVAECTRDQVGDEGFFAMHNRIFETITSGFDFNRYADYAVELGADRDKFQTCYDSEEFRDEIYGDTEMGKQVGVSGTPGFILNGQTISGAQPYDVFVKAIESQL